MDEKERKKIVLSNTAKALQLFKKGESNRSSYKIRFESTGS